MERKPLFAYKFVYWTTPTAKAQFMYIFAYSYKQAVYFFKQHYQAWGYDWELDGSKHEMFFANKHKAGEAWTGICEL